MGETLLVLAVAFQAMWMCPVAPVLAFALLPKAVQLISHYGELERRPRA